jgi:uncharacterized protein YggE
MARAAAIAGGARRDLGNIVRLEEQRNSSGPMPMYRMAADMAQAGGAPTPITPGDVEIRAQVTAVVALK